MINDMYPEYETKNERLGAGLVVLFVLLPMVLILKLILKLKGE